jgi:hypothetical protein
LDFGLLIIILFILAPLLEKLLARGRQAPGQPPPMPPGQRRPGEPRMPQQRLPAPHDEETPFRSVPAAHREEDESAASVLPDDLWEILTGERRPPAQRPAEPARPAPPALPTGSAERRPRIDEPHPPIDRPAPPPLEQRPLPSQRTPVLRQERDRTPRSRERPVEVRSRTPRERDPERLRPGRPASAADAYVRPEHVRAERPVHVRPERVVTSYDDLIPGDEERHTRFHERLDSSAALAAATAAARAAAAAGSQEYRFGDAADLRRAIVMAEILGRPKGLE